MLNEPLRSFIKLGRKQMTRLQMVRTRKAKRIIPYPIAIEKEYTKFISSIMQKLSNVAIERLQTILQKWVVKADSIHYDALDGELEEFMRAVDAELLLLYGTSYVSMNELAIAIQRVADKLFGKFDNALQKQIEAIAGIPFNPTEEWWPEAKALWSQNNYTLIKGLGQEFVTKLNSTITTGLQSGWSYEEIASAIEKLSDKMTGYRSRFIARDQVGKLNSIIANTQFQAIGMDTYYWHTAQDERVRGNPRGKYPKAVPSHYDMEGLLLRFDRPDLYSDDLGKTWKKKTARMEMQEPGMAILCRCVHVPSWMGDLTAIDNEIIEEGA